MKKFIVGFALVIALFVFASAFTDDVTKKKVTIGSTVPTFVIFNNAKSLNIGEPSDKFTLVNFWKSSDAESRVACNQYDALLADDAELKEKIEYVAINLDGSEILFNEIVAVDGLDASKQYRINSNAVIDLTSEFNLDKGLGAVLITPEGVVESFNPTPESIKRLRKR